MADDSIEKLFIWPTEMRQGIPDEVVDKIVGLLPGIQNIVIIGMTVEAVGKIGIDIADRIVARSPEEAIRIVKFMLLQAANQAAKGIPKAEPVNPLDDKK